MNAHFWRLRSCTLGRAGGRWHPSGRRHAGAPMVWLLHVRADRPDGEFGRVDLRRPVVLQLDIPALGAHLRIRSIHGEKARGKLRRQSATEDALACRARRARAEQPGGHDRRHALDGRHNFITADPWLAPRAIGSRWSGRSCWSRRSSWSRRSCRSRGSGRPGRSHGAFVANRPYRTHRARCARRACGSDGAWKTLRSGHALRPSDAFRARRPGRSLGPDGALRTLRARGAFRSRRSLRPDACWTDWRLVRALQRQVETVELRLCPSPRHCQQVRSGRKCSGQMHHELRRIGGEDREREESSVT